MVTCINKLNIRSALNENKASNCINTIINANINFESFYVIFYVFLSERGHLQTWYSRV